MKTFEEINQKAIAEDMPFAIVALEIVEPQKVKPKLSGKALENYNRQKAKDLEFEAL